MGELARPFGRALALKGVGSIPGKQHGPQHSGVGESPKRPAPVGSKRPDAVVAVEAQHPLSYVRGRPLRRIAGASYRGKTPWSGHTRSRHHRGVVIVVQRGKGSLSRPHLKAQSALSCHVVLRAGKMI